MRFWLTLARATTLIDPRRFFKFSTSRSSLLLLSYSKVSQSLTRRAWGWPTMAFKVISSVEISSGSCSTSLCSTRSPCRGLFAARAFSSASSRSSCCLIRKASSSSFERHCVRSPGNDKNSIPLVFFCVQGFPLTQTHYFSTVQTAALEPPLQDLCVCVSRVAQVSQLAWPSVSRWPRRSGWPRVLP